MHAPIAREEEAERRAQAEASQRRRDENARELDRQQALQRQLEKMDSRDQKKE